MTTLLDCGHPAPVHPPGYCGAAGYAMLGVHTGAGVAP
jgi:hypothetical protein